MSHSRALRLFVHLFGVGLLALATLAFVACSGKDDADSSSNNSSKDAAAPAGSSSNDAGAAFGELFRMGSGASGAGNAARPQTSASPTKEDEQYVRQICVAATGFVKAIEKIGDSASSNGSKEITSEEDFAKAFGDLFDAMMGPMADFLDGFAKATPPKDLKDWHAQAAKVMHDAATSLRKGDFAALEKLDSSTLADPPAEAMARLEKAVANVKECNELEQLGQDGSLFGN